MKSSNARMLDDLIGRTNGRRLYQFFRDGHSSDIGEIVSELERRLPIDEATTALVNLTWYLIESRPTRGADEAREGDLLRDSVVASLKKNFAS